MSKVVFDKHVEFCEAYMAGCQDVLGRLLRDGLDARNLEIDELQTVPRKYQLWVSAEMSSTLEDFEGRIVDIGARMRGWRDSHGAGFPEGFLRDLRTFC
jgi:hypothetical protein